jgi:hypothetical protein
MCELRKLILHQAGLRVLNTQNELSNVSIGGSSSNLTGTLCVSNLDDLRDALQTISVADKRYVTCISAVLLLPCATCLCGD